MGNVEGETLGPDVRAAWLQQGRCRPLDALAAIFALNEAGSCRDKSQQRTWEVGSWLCRCAKIASRRIARQALKMAAVLLLAVDTLCI